MARIHRVARAQVRYPMVEQLDAEGRPVRVKVNRTTKRGGEIYRTKTYEDRTQPPLPPYTCDFCKNPIEPGTAYMWVQPRTGPYGGRKRFRHAEHPAWHTWELSDSLSAQLDRIGFEYWKAIDSAESTDDVQSALDEAAGEVRDLAEQKRESAQNIEEGFGHETYISQDLADTAEQLDAWANEIESANIPDLEEPTEEDTDEGESEAETQARLLEEWREEVRAEVTIVDEVPV